MEHILTLQINQRADDLDASDTATDSFTYTVSDGTATDTATLIFTVTGVNDVPTASDKTVTTKKIPLMYFQLLILDTQMQMMMMH